MAREGVCVCVCVWFVRVEARCSSTSSVVRLEGSAGR